MNPSQRYINILFNATFPPNYDKSSNLMMARSFLHFENITKAASCFDAYPEPKAPGKCEGSCFFQPFESLELEKLVESGSFTVLIELSPVYANSSQRLATGMDCDTLRDEDFKTSQEAITQASVSQRQRLLKLNLRGFTQT